MLIVTPPPPVCPLGVTDTRSAPLSPTIIIVGLVTTPSYPFAAVIPAKLAKPPIDWKKLTNLCHAPPIASQIPPKVSLKKFTNLSQAQPIQF